MSWLRPQHLDAKQKRLDAILAENALVSSQAEASAEEVKESVEVEHQALAQTIELTHRRREARENRARERIKRDPSLHAVSEVLKLLEARH